MNTFDEDDTIYKFKHSYSFTHEQLMVEFNISIPTVLHLEIIQYAYNICCDCKKYVVFAYECNCKKIRCMFHQYINTAVYGISCTPNYCYTNKEIRIRCIVTKCNNKAYYGYEDIICYCEYHAQGKRVIKYIYCSTFVPLVLDCTHKTMYVHDTNHRLAAHCIKHMKKKYKYRKNYHDFRKN